MFYKDKDNTMIIIVAKGGSNSNLLHINIRHEIVSVIKSFTRYGLCRHMKAPFSTDVLSVLVLHESRHKLQLIKNDTKDSKGASSSSFEF